LRKSADASAPGTRMAGRIQKYLGITYGFRYT
jgi:hypothetical protein